MSETGTLHTDQLSEDIYSEYPAEVKTRTKKMIIYVFIFAVVMLFAGLTSGYIVKMGGEYWVHINPPVEFYWSLLFLALSSVTAFLSTRFMKKSNAKASLLALVLTFVFGIGFTVTQLKGWSNLTAKGMGFTVMKTKQGLDKYQWNHLDEISGTYGEDYYIHKDGKKLVLKNGEFFLPGDHEFTTPVTDKVMRGSNNASAFLVILVLLHLVHLSFGLMYILANIFRIKKGTINSNNTVSLEVNSIYWHFMGILWVYLFVFLFVLH